MITRRGLLKAFGGFIAAGFASSAYAVGVEPMLRLRTVTYRIVPPGWPTGQTLRLVALADIHACEPWMSAARIRGICEHANTLGGDIVLLLGDYLSSMRAVWGKVPPADWAAALSILKAPLGVHAVLGNHDWWDDLEAQAAGGGETFSHRMLREAGIAVYSNRAVRIETMTGAFWLAGLEDQIALRPGRQWNRGGFVGLDDLPGTLAQVTDDAPLILMAHEPDVFPRVPSRVSLTLSGHTHGGQVRLFGYSPMVPSAYGNRYAYGHVVEDGRHLCVSGGLGCSIAPIRFGSPPEIMVVELG
ncbi:metallophosphoesterase [Shinella yambaruensis]|uniref:Phosphohydrolase n=1 Tax=Shinella yambaruensis TaxID=415996 RepID=A0ABQ5ZEU9_9HYPH|nr:metallophosphoesterase [Shinella yambaruensis]MCJ8026958.1 metallophosphoesterase [Shinella yambaruensis]MCU7982150.1 metallophosphoesterase [Shinella yambaruensis]GLR51325.1 phosphohydrolase [Shinella yambaruensis]